MIVPVAERSRGGLLPLREEGSSAGTMSRCLARGVPDASGKKTGRLGALDAEPMTEPEPARNMRS